MPAINRARGKRWVFTLNNYTEGEKQLLNDLGDSEHVEYAVLGYEEGESGTPHIQGFVIFRDRKTFNQAKGLLGGRCHVEIAKGNPKQASDYCKKDGAFDEHGELPEVTQGKRSDFEKLKEYLKEYDGFPSTKELWETFPSLMGRYPDAVRRMVSVFCTPPAVGDVALRPFQTDLEAYLESDPDDRKIKFVVDMSGNSGKSWFARYYYRKNHEKCQLLSIGKRDDLAFAIDTEKSVFIFDVPRGQMQYLQQNVLEMIKDGIIFSPKYASQTKMMHHRAHCVVLSNEMPERTMTADRYDIMDLPLNANDLINDGFNSVD